MRQAGTWDPLLQCLRLDTPLLLSQKIKRNYKGLKITVHVCSWGKLWTIIYKRPTPTPRPLPLPNYHFWRAGSKSRVPRLSPAHTTTKGVGKPVQPPSPAWFLDSAPTLTSCKAPASPSQRAKLGNVLLVSAPPRHPPTSAVARASVKPCLNFLSGLWSVAIPRSGTWSVTGSGAGGVGRRSPHYTELQNGAL